MSPVAASPLRHPGSVTERCTDAHDPSLEAFEADGGYAGARRAFKQLDPDALLELVEASGLQPRGRWSRRVADEWRAMRAADPAPRSVVCHAGPHKAPHPGDALLVARAPHLVVEGLLVAGRAVEAETVHLCVDPGDDAGAAAVASALDEARAAGYLGAKAFKSRTSIECVTARPDVSAPCGDGTAVLEAIEGRLARPRPRPPAVTTHGLAGRPTWLVDPETCAQLALIARHGPEWLRERGEPDAPGSAVFAVSGHVERPGLYELPLGTRLGELVFEHAGGVAGGHKVGAVLPGGRSTAALSPGALDVPLTDPALREQGSALGRCEVVVIDDQSCMVATASALGAYFRGLSCGHAVHCREGTLLIHELLDRMLDGDCEAADLDRLVALCDEVGSDAHCGVADRVAIPVRSLVALFRDDFESHLYGDGCGRGREVGVA